MVTQEAYGMHAVLSLVSVGAGVSVVPQSMSGFQADQIHYYPLLGSKAAFVLVLSYRSLSPSAQAFIDDFNERPFDINQWA